MFDGMPFPKTNFEPLLPISKELLNINALKASLLQGESNDMKGPLPPVGISRIPLAAILCGCNLRKDYAIPFDASPRHQPEGMEIPSCQ
ncbi:hypothetical protein AVEN_218196-1 [Araneus ventricosus]|uniref:Uncharacterized protein n=1 Tax=Araneus ventricosus TaxID=182803 RepID=A0A4Y2F434_ARAVE|nr:hypothetical protein AVEN_218196-1 [Araneus ventricosus]